jgi:uncharacterized protein YndB with AHSA1/START domain
MANAVEASITIRMAPEPLLRQFLDLDTMTHWWGVARGLVDPQPGGLWVLAWDVSEQGFRYISTGVIADYVAGGVLRIENLVYLNPERKILGPMSLSIAVKEEASGAKLQVRQSGYRKGEDWEWYHRAVVEGWPKVLVALKDYCETV